MENLTLQELEVAADQLKALPRGAKMGTPGNVVSRNELLRLNAFARTICELTDMPTMALAVAKIEQMTGKSNFLAVCKRRHSTTTTTTTTTPTTTMTATAVAEARARHGLLRHPPYAASTPIRAWKLPPQHNRLRRPPTKG